MAHAAAAAADTRTDRRQQRQRRRRRRRALSSCSTSSLTSSASSSSSMSTSFDGMETETLSYSSDDDDVGWSGRALVVVGTSSSGSGGGGCETISITSSRRRQSSVVGENKRSSLISVVEKIEQSLKLLRTSRLLIIVAAAIIGVSTLFTFLNDRYAVSVVVTKRTDVSVETSSEENDDLHGVYRQHQQHQQNGTHDNWTTSVSPSSTSSPLSSSTSPRYHFCGKSQVSPINGDETSNSLKLLYQCSGESYDKFASNLLELAINKTSSTASQTHSGMWGKREYPLPPNMTVLALGNSHLRQVSKTLACQYSHLLKRIDFLQRPQGWPSDSLHRRRRHHRRRQIHADEHDDEHEINTADDAQQVLRQSESRDTVDSPDESNPSIMIVQSTTSPDAFVLEFQNGARWISITNTVLAYSEVWNELIDRIFLSQVSRLTRDHERNASDTNAIHIDAVVFGKFTTYQESINTNFQRTMMDEQEAYMSVWERESASNDEPDVNNDTISNSSSLKSNNDLMSRLEYSRWVDFENYPPPHLVDIARVYRQQTIVAVSMFSKKDSQTAQFDLNAYMAAVEHQVGANKTHGVETTSKETNMLARFNEPTVNSETREGSSVLSTDVHFVNGRKYIEEMGIECGSDDKDAIGSCHEPINNTMGGFASIEDEWKNTKTAAADINVTHAKNATQSPNQRRPRDASDMHRCAGRGGGHADLISFDVIELMYNHLEGN